MKGGRGRHCDFPHHHTNNKQYNYTLPRSLRSRYSAASINICTIPIAAIFNNNPDNNTDNKTIRCGTPWLYTTCFRSDHWLSLSLSLLMTVSWLAALCHWLVYKARGNVELFPAMCQTGYLKVKRTASFPRDSYNGSGWR